MPTSGEEPYSNPIAPGLVQQQDDDHSALTNADFRKLLMTPRQTPGVAPPSRPRHELPKEYDESEDAALRRRKKKSYYAKLKKQEEEREKELAEKYRDRAKERREGQNPDYQNVDPVSTSKTAEYRAVAPTSDAMNSAAERRRLAIQESKFLGGDMEHTHLVKGLDFALLQKVKSEIAAQEPQKEDVVASKEGKGDKKEPTNDGVEFRTKKGRKIYNAIFNARPSERNELFHPGRMAYVFDIEDELADSDLPTTLIRSKADCPVVENQTTLTTNDIVINKLTQILSYLRQGMRASKKQKKKDKDIWKGKGKDLKSDAVEDGIYGNIGDYDPFTREQNQVQKEKKVPKLQKYFERSREEEMEKAVNPEVSVKEFVKNVSEKYGKSSAWKEVTSSEEKQPGLGKQRSRSKKESGIMPDSYAECYPGAMEMIDAAGDSEDEADYTKMDMGNKKGPIGRWDFDTEEEYNTYMESKEALPKAAFQFGIKMSEGRKTRTKPGHLTEKQKLDREWQKISQIISKRKGPDISEGDGKRRKEV